MAGVAIFLGKSILHLDNIQIQDRFSEEDQGVKKRNSYSLLVTIDGTGTYIITYNIIFCTKKR